MARLSLLLTTTIICLTGCGEQGRTQSETAPPPEAVVNAEVEVPNVRPPDDKTRWQEYLDNKEFDFREEEMDIFRSLEEFDGDCQIHMVINQPDDGSIEFRFVRDGWTVLSVPGTQSVPFRHSDNIVYFAHHTWLGPHGMVGAYDLATGRRLWLKKLKAVQCGWGKGNQINLRLHDGVLHAIGHVSGFEYEEIFALKSGERLAYRVFRGLPVSDEWFRTYVPEEFR
jgi:hypothetical protein